MIHQRALSYWQTLAPAARSAAIPTLKDELKDKDASVRLLALQFLLPMGAADPNTVRAVLLEAFKDPQPRIRSQAAGYVGRMGAQAKDALPELVRLLKDPDEAVQNQAVRVLSQINPVAVPTAVPTLLKAPARRRSPRPPACRPSPQADARAAAERRRACLARVAAGSYARSSSPGGMGLEPDQPRGSEGSAAGPGRAVERS